MSVSKEEKLKKKEERRRRKEEKRKKKQKKKTTPPSSVFEILKEGEEIMFAFKENFFLALIPGFNLIPPWVIVTNHRVIFLDPKFPSGYDFIGFPWEETTYLKFSRGLFFGSFEIKDEKGNERKIQWLQNPEPFFELKQYCVQRIQSVAIENPTIKESVWLVWKMFEIQKSLESSGRIKMEMVNRTTENMPSNFAVAPPKTEQEIGMPKLNFKQTMKIIDMEAASPSDKLAVANKMLKEGIITREVFQQIVNAITETTGEDDQEGSSEEQE